MSAWDAQKYSKGYYGRSWLKVAELCVKHEPKRNKRTRRLALMMYRRQRAGVYRPLIHNGNKP